MDNVPIVLGQYRLGKTLGIGAFGKVKSTNPMIAVSGYRHSTVITLLNSICHWSVNISHSSIFSYLLQWLITSSLGKKLPSKYWIRVRSSTWRWQRKCGEKLIYWRCVHILISSDCKSRHPICSMHSNHLFFEIVDLSCNQHIACEIVRHMKSLRTMLNNWVRWQ